MENKLVEEHYLVLYIMSKTFGSLILLFCIFLLIMYCLTTNTEKTLLYRIKIELIISCMFVPIGLTLPITPVRKEQDQPFPKFLCHTQSFLICISHFTAILLFTSLPYITYKALTDPKFIENSPRIAHLKISLIGWGFPLILAIFFESFGKASLYSYFCWFSDEIISYIYFGVTVSVLLTLSILIIKLRKKLTLFLEENNLPKQEYFKGFRSVYIVFSLVVIILVIDCVDSFTRDLGGETFTFISLIANCILECTFYFLIPYFACFKKDMFSDMCSRCKKLCQKKDIEDPTIVTLLGINSQENEN